MPIYRGSGGSGNSSTSANANQVAIDSAAAAQSAIDAAASAAAALVSENEAESAETNAETSETNASTSASNAATSETNAATQATNAATSATNAGTSETNAATSASNANTSETNAASSASSASTSETNAASSESTATTKAAEASTSATNASNSATASANSATASANSATASAASAAAAQAAQEAIDGLYLGAQASDPTVDLNGDPVTVGDWYFNTVINLSKIYDGSGWEVLTATGSVTSVTGTGTVSGLTLTGTVTTSGNLTLGGTLTETDTLNTVTGRGATTTNNITVGNLTSTGIDDNATSTAITISSSENVTFAGEIDAGESRFFKPSTFWSATTAFFGHNYGSLATQGSFDLHLTANGYRNSSGTWTSLGTNSQAGASQIALTADGGIGFNTDATKNTGDSYVLTRRVTINNAGNVGIGTNAPLGNLSVEGEGRVVTIGDSGTTNVPEIKSTNADGTGEAYLQMSAYEHRFFTGGQQRVTISNNGNVGIGSDGRLLVGTAVEGQANADELTIANDTGDCGITIRSPSTHGSKIFFSDATSGSGEHAGYIILDHTSDSMQFGLKNAESMRIDSSGRVGIGTDSPSKILHVVATEGTVPSSSGIGIISLIQNNSTTTNSSGIGILGGTGANSSVFFSDADDADVGAIVYEHNNNAMAFKVNAAEKMRIDSSGKVGIGVSDPDAPLEIQSGVVDSEVLNVRGFDAGRGLNVSISNEGSITDALVDFNNELSNGRLSFSLGGSEKMRIHSSGNVGIGTSSPSGVLAVTDGANALIVGQSGENFYSGNTHRFFSQNYTTEYMHINASGNITTVGSGNSSPQLNVTNSGTGSSYLRFNDTATTASQGRYIGSAGDNMVFGRWGVAEHLRIDASGKMALTANSGGLQLRTGTSGQDAFIDWQFNTTSTNFIRMGINYDTRATTGWMIDSGYPITLDYTTNLVFKSGGTEKARLDVNGHLLVGRSSAGASATDYGSNIYATGQIYSYTSSPGSSDMYRGYNNAGTLAYSIKANGTVYSVSDRVLKENIVDSESALAIVNDIKVRSFDWREDGDHVSHGFIAQELNEAYPEAASEPIEDQVHWSVDYTRLVPVLTKALQEQQAMIEELKAEVAALKGAS